MNLIIKKRCKIFMPKKSTSKPPFLVLTNFQERLKIFPGNSTLLRKIIFRQLDQTRNVLVVSFGGNIWLSSVFDKHLPFNGQQFTTRRAGTGRISAAALCVLTEVKLLLDQFIFTISQQPLLVSCFGMSSVNCSGTHLSTKLEIKWVSSQLLLLLEIDHV